MKNKKILKEQSSGDCSIWTNKHLYAMCELGCLSSAFSIRKIGSEQVAVKESTPAWYSATPENPNIYVAIFGDYNQSKGGATAKYYYDSELTKPVNDNAGEQKYITVNCKYYNKNQNTTLSPDVKQALLKLKVNTEGEIIDFITGMENLKGTAEGYELKKLSEIPEWGSTYKGFFDENLNAKLKEVYVWRKGSPKQYQSSSKQANKCITHYTNLGYVASKTKPVQGMDSGVDAVNLQSIPDCGFTSEYWMVKDFNNLSPQNVVNGLSEDYKKLTKGGIKKSSCKSFINLYLTAYNKKTSISQTTLESYKPIVKECRNQFNFVLLKKNLETLEYAQMVKTSTGDMLDYSLSTNRTTNEELNLNIKNSIKENLIKIKNNKKIITEESDIIKKRFNIIIESSKIETESQKKQFFNKLIKEMYYLKGEGVSDKVLNEQLLDLLKTIFSKSPEAVQQIFKEHFADFIIGLIAPSKKDSFIAKFISTAIGNMPITELTKMTDCGYLTNFLSKSMVETLVRQGTDKKLADKELGSVLFFDGLRNAVIDALNESNLGQKVQGLFADFICSSLPNIKNKMADASEKIKKAAIDTMGNKTLATG